MRRFLLFATISTGAVVGIWLGVPSDTANRVATCPVRLSDSGLALAGDAGLDLRRNELLRFPVVRRVQADGGLAFDLPPNMDDVRGLMFVKDWSDCTIDPVATYPGVAARWDAGLPFVFPGATSRRCVRPKRDAGLVCMRRGLDGGAYDFGDRNVFPRSEAMSATSCEPVECSIYLGEDPEIDL